MKGVEEILIKNKLVAMVFRSGIQVSGVRFFTDEENLFQIGFHNRKKGVKLTPHIHKIEKPLTIPVIQEVLYVQSGKIRVVFYTKRGEIICKKILKKDDSVLFIDVGHGVDILEDSRIFQVKQGPYPGTEHAKIYLKNQMSNRKSALPLS